MKHPDQNDCNIRLETGETFLNKCLQHVAETLATYVTCATSSIYFCNIHEKQLQHTFKTTETPETYICNVGEGGLGWSLPVVRVGAGGEHPTVLVGVLGSAGDDPTRAHSGHRQGWLQRGIPTVLGVGEETEETPCCQ